MTYYYFFFKQVLSMFQLHYPELLRKMVLINCPTLFNVLWATVKPFIREATRKKMIIVGSKYFWRKPHYTTLKLNVRVRFILVLFLKGLYNTYLTKDLHFGFPIGSECSYTISNRNKVNIGSGGGVFCIKN